MKFTWFNLMPWPYLPEDFREKYRSVWVDNVRRLGTAGKILFPIPDRGLSERLYRIRAQTAILWGASDRLFPAVYGEHFHQAIPHSTFDQIQEASHMLPYERTQAVVERLRALAAAS